MPAAWSRRADLQPLLTESPDEAAFLRPADGFPLSDAEYTATLRDAAAYLRRRLAQIHGTSGPRASVY